VFEAAYSALATPTVATTRIVAAFDPTKQEALVDGKRSPRVLTMTSLARRSPVPMRVSPLSVDFSQVYKVGAGSP
jgi:hypothetical protein